MACCALNQDLTDCGNWSMLDSPYCYAHREMTDGVLKNRWKRRFLIGVGGITLFHYPFAYNKQRILNDLSSGLITLKESDFTFEAKDKQIDVYILLVSNGFMEADWHLGLLARTYGYFFRVFQYFGVYRLQDVPITKSTILENIENYILLGSGKRLYEFLYIVPVLAYNSEENTHTLLNYIPNLLDTDSCKELAWWSYNELDVIRKHYEDKLGEDHPLTKCLVQRWLLDIKELYETEKQMQKIKMDQCKEELMMNRWHPNRIEMFINMGLDPTEM